MTETGNDVNNVAAVTDDGDSFSQISDDIKCANCRWFDARCGFCRLNPPQIVMQYVNRTAYPNAVFPKVPMPDLDWCSKFSPKT